MPRAGRAFMGGGHSLQQCSDMARRGHVRGQDDGTADWVAFMRHGGRSAAAGHGWLVHLCDLGRRQMLDIRGHFCQGTEQFGEPRAERRNPAPPCVPA